VGYFSSSLKKGAVSKGFKVCTGCALPFGPKDKWSFHPHGKLGGNCDSGLMDFAITVCWYFFQNQPQWIPEITGHVMDDSTFHDWLGDISTPSDFPYPNVIWLFVQLDQRNSSSYTTFGPC